MENKAKKFQDITIRYLKSILAILFCIAVILAITAYFISKIPRPSSSVVIDPLTRKPIPEEIVQAIRARQKAELRVMSLGGKIIGKSLASLQVEVIADKKNRVLDVAITPETKLFELVPTGKTVGPRRLPETKEQSISFADIKIGESVTLFSKTGILINQPSTEKITVTGVMLRRYPEPDLSWD